jgi:hypothetical protein
MDESKRQHLEFIQNTITRLNENSCKIKNLEILLVTAIIALYTTAKSTKVLFVSFYSMDFRRILFATRTQI